MDAPWQALAGVWSEAGGEPAALGQIAVSGPAQVLPSTFAVTAAATATVGAATLAAAKLWQERGATEPHRGATEPKQVRVATRDAAIAFRSQDYLRAPEQDLTISDPITGDYQTGDGWIRLHGNYPLHRVAARQALGLTDGQRTVAEAVRDWAATELEEAVVAAGGAAAAMRTTKEWATHPQGAAVAGLPLVGAAGSASLAPIDWRRRPVRSRGYGCST